MKEDDPLLPLEVLSQRMHMLVGLLIGVHVGVVIGLVMAAGR